MGHRPESVFNVGPMVLDSFPSLPNANRFEFEKQTGFRFRNNNLLVTYHPETLLSDSGLGGFKTFLKALENVPCNILFTHPNADEGSQQIMCHLERFANLSLTEPVLFPL